MHIPSFLTPFELANQGASVADQEVYRYFGTRVDRGMLVSFMIFQYLLLIIDESSDTNIPCMREVSKIL